jgi:hypothetical protein
VDRAPVDRAEPGLVTGEREALDEWYARHNGHAYLIRERVDGATGD